MSNFESPIPLSEIESVLAWVDTFKLSRPTKKLNRDFSDAVLLAEILNVHYPKLVEMHNYPPRNSHSLKLNNWLTLNRKVLKKLKLNLCINTMEQLANCNNGVIERVLIMVREKIKRDEELNKSMKDAEQNMSSGGSFYEACGEDDNILVVPTKIRVNGVLETIQQKVVNYESYLSLKEELKDARDSCELLKQKVEHLDNLLILKEERIEELQKQLERKQARRKEAEAYQNSLQVPFETVPSPAPPVPPVPQGLSLEELIAPVCNTVVTQFSKTLPTKITEANKLSKEESKIPIRPDSTIAIKPIAIKHSDVSGKDLANGLIENAINLGTSKFSYTKLSGKTSNESVGNNLITYVDVNDDKGKEKPLPGAINDDNDEDIFADVDRIKSDVFKEVEIVDDKVPPDFDEFEDSEQGTITTIEQTIQKEITDIVIPLNLIQNC